MSIKFFITNDFIKDCMDPNKLIYVFGGKFNSPVKGSQIITDTTNNNSNIIEPTNPYKKEEENLNQYNNSWFKVIGSQSLPAVLFNNLVNGNILPSDINLDRTNISVKIPWESNLYNQLIGYLTYYTNAGEGDKLVHESLGVQSNDLPPEFRNLTEKVGFVFESWKYNIGLQRSLENPKDSNSYINIDLSKLNIAAKILPLRYINTSDDSGSTYYWGRYNNEHLHNLVLTSTDKSGFKDADLIEESFIDIKSLRDNTMDPALVASNLFSDKVINKVGKVNYSYFLTNDGRYINDINDEFNNNTSVPIVNDMNDGVLSIKAKLSNGSIVEGTALFSGFNIQNPAIFDTALYVASIESETNKRVTDADLYDIIYL